MSAMVDPCPWCGSREIGWFIPPFGRTGHATCDECGAQGPSFVATDRTNRKLTDADAIESWNRGGAA